VMLVSGLGGCTVITSAAAAAAADDDDDDDDDDEEEEEDVMMMMMMMMTRQVLALFTPEEQAEVVYRLGYLNLFDPVRPDGWIELCLARRDERQV
jgi:hypothetical protein